MGKLYMNLQDENSKKAWRVAQNSLAQFLQNNSFEIWEERRIENKRLDILAKRIVGEKIFYIVFEVKHYNKVSAGNEDKFLEQLNKYLKLLILRELDRKKYSYVSKKIFFTGYLVFANDYGIYKNRRKNWRKNRNFPDNKELETIWKRNVYLFSSTQDHIQRNLESIGLTFYSQSKISDFFNEDKQ
ncbi:MAG: hypothetical protein HeimAB125_02040 [Candidatus Heimdallarchaeota archaeon AB_125]|nr:MAG: hypothetical protein HeimAB125_02040 [Candidatus Heimdallarchaeota archaeon AB_125]